MIIGLCWENAIIGRVFYVNVRNENKLLKIFNKHIRDKWSWIGVGLLG